MLPCPRRRPAHPAIEYGPICHACPAIPSTVNHDGREPAPPSSRKIPLRFSTRLPDGVFATHNWPHPPCGSAYRPARPSTARLPGVALPTRRFNQRGQPDRCSHGLPRIQIEERPSIGSAQVWRPPTQASWRESVARQLHIKFVVRLRRSPLEPALTQLSCTPLHESG